jgi:uncharacterized SAM-binding protein YcdF (DUF218 family)
MLSNIANHLIVDEAPQKSDVIIVISGDSKNRLVHGAQLYKSGFADKVILSGFGMSIIPRITMLGIPESSILLEEKARTTFLNAKYSLKIVRENKFKSAILVTSPYHTFRASLIFGRFFRGIDLTICAVPHDSAMTENWWKYGSSFRVIVSEYLKLLFHYLFEWQ